MGLVPRPAACLALFLACLLPALLFAQEAPRITQIDITGHRLVEESAIRLRLKTRVGDSFSVERVREAEVRCGLTRRFPYAVLYTIEPEGVLIVAVMHGSREPGDGKSRLEI